MSQGFIRHKDSYHVNHVCIRLGCVKLPWEGLRLGGPVGY